MTLTRNDYFSKENKNSRAPILNADTPKLAGQIKKGRTTYKHLRESNREPHPTHIGIANINLLRTHPVFF